jgi:TnpA family transposase
MTQGTLIRKLCTSTAPNPTRHAIFEFDKLVRSLYTLRYLRDPQLERNVTARRIALSPTTSYARPSRRLAERKN